MQENREQIPHIRLVHKTSKEMFFSGEITQRVKFFIKLNPITGEEEYYTVDENGKATKIEKNLLSKVQTFKSQEPLKLTALTPCELTIVTSADNKKTAKLTPAHYRKEKQQDGSILWKQIPKEEIAVKKRPGRPKKKEESVQEKQIVETKPELITNQLVTPAPPQVMQQNIQPIQEVPIQNQPEQNLYVETNQAAQMNNTSFPTNNDNVKRFEDPNNYIVSENGDDLFLF